MESFDLLVSLTSERVSYISPTSISRLQVFKFKESEIPLCVNSTDTFHRFVEKDITYFFNTIRICKRWKFAGYKSWVKAFLYFASTEYLLHFNIKGHMYLVGTGCIIDYDTWTPLIVTYKVPTVPIRDLSAEISRVPCKEIIYSINPIVFTEEKYKPIGNKVKTSLLPNLHTANTDSLKYSIRIQQESPLNIVSTTFPEVKDLSMVNKTILHDLQSQEFKRILAKRVSEIY